MCAGDMVKFLKKKPNVKIKKKNEGEWGKILENNQRKKGKCWYFFQIDPLLLPPLGIFSLTPLLPPLNFSFSFLFKILPYSLGH